MELLNAIVITVNGVVWGWPMIILLLGTLSVEKDTKKYIHNLDAKDDTPVPVVK